MNTNLAQIIEDTIFISGNDLTTTGMPNEDFAKLETQIKACGFKVFNPCGIKDAKVRIALSVMCAKVVTLPNYDLFENAVKEVHVNRVLGKEIIAGADFDGWFKRKKPPVATQSS